MTEGIETPAQNGRELSACLTWPYFHPDSCSGPKMSNYLEAAIGIVACLYLAAVMKCSEWLSR